MRFKKREDVCGFYFKVRTNGNKQNVCRQVLKSIRWCKWDTTTQQILLLLSCQTKEKGGLVGIEDRISLSQLEGLGEIPLMGKCAKAKWNLINI